MRAIADVKTRLAIKDNEVILGGYSSGGDVGYPIIFKNSKSFALALFENTAPGNAAQSTTLAQSAAPQNGWRFPIRHLCHDNDEIGTYKCAALRGIIGAGGTFATLGHASVLHEMDGTHWMPDANGRGTWADFHATLRPYLSQTWTTP
jgi:predicted esterase